MVRSWRHTIIQNAPARARIVGERAAGRVPKSAMLEASEASDVRNALAGRRSRTTLVSRSTDCLPGSPVLFPSVSGTRWTPGPGPPGRTSTLERSLDRALAWTTSLRWSGVGLFHQFKVYRESSTPLRRARADSGLDHVFRNFGFAPDSDVNHGEPS
jgi:hypothetical protein